MASEPGVRWPTRPALSGRLPAPCPLPAESYTHNPVKTMSPRCRTARAALLFCACMAFVGWARLSGAARFAGEEPVTGGRPKRRHDERQWGRPGERADICPRTPLSRVRAHVLAQCRDVRTVCLVSATWARTPPAAGRCILMHAQDALTAALERARRGRPIGRGRRDNGIPLTVNSPASGRSLGSQRSSTREKSPDAVTVIRDRGFPGRLVVKPPGSQLSQAAWPLCLRTRTDPGTLLLWCETDVVPMAGRHPAKNGQAGTFAPTWFLTATAESASPQSKCIGDARADREDQVQHGGSEQDSAHVWSVELAEPRAGNPGIEDLRPVFGRWSSWKSRCARTVVATANACQNSLRLVAAQTRSYQSTGGASEGCYEADSIQSRSSSRTKRSTCSSISCSTSSMATGPWAPTPRTPSSRWHRPRARRGRISRSDMVRQRGHGKPAGPLPVRHDCWGEYRPSRASRLARIGQPEDRR